ncbi:MAG TPA: AAA family ATPase, partial [Aliarcobacter thereius]
MKLKKLPIGIQTFSKIREDDFVYVDKTGIAYDLIEKYEYVFLSRPRRFGKSLFLDTLRNIFEAKKEYFKDLEIESKWNWEVKHPVIRISFAAGKLKTKKDLEEKWEEIFRDNQRNLEIDCEFEAGDRRCFSELIKKAYDKYQEKVVILVDEYDKPIIDNITDVETATLMRD